MRSLFAALRNLVLPAGKTSGTRIILDGVQGRILVYNEDGDLIGWVAPIDGVDPAGTPYFAGVGMNPYESSFPNSATRTAIALDANNGFVRFSRNPNGPGTPAAFVTDGEIKGYNPNGQNNAGAQLVMRAPTTNPTTSSMELILQSISQDGTDQFTAELGPDDFTSASALVNATIIRVAGFIRRKTMTAGVYADEMWNNVVFQNGWSNWGAPYATVQYRLDALGWVNLTGVARGGSLVNGTVVFNLPAGYRPAADHQFHPANSATNSILEVTAAGDCLIRNIGSNALPITGFRFPVA